jgi:hypothetical protein
MRTAVLVGSIASIGLGLLFGLWFGGKDPNVPVSLIALTLCCGGFLFLVIALNESF